MLQHRNRLCEANEAQASCKEVVDTWEQAADMRDGLGGEVGCSASSIGVVSDSDIEDTEEEMSIEGSVEGGGETGEEVEREISWFMRNGTKYFLPATL